MRPSTFSPLCRLAAQTLRVGTESSIASGSRSAFAALPGSVRHSSHLTEYGLPLYTDSSLPAPKKKERKEKKLTRLERRCRVDGVWVQHQANTPEQKNHSPLKFRWLSKQISKKPVDEALLQLEFSKKQHAGAVIETLKAAKEDAIAKGLDKNRLIVGESWVTKSGMNKELKVMGRGRAGVMTHKHSKLWMILREGKTVEEKQHEQKIKALSKIKWSGYERLGRKSIGNGLTSTWAW